MKTKRESLIVLKGEGVNEHVLEADALVYDKTKQLSEIHVGKGGVLRHVDPAGRKGDHNTITIEEGKWLVGKQVEFNPFTNEITGIFD